MADVRPFAGLLYNPEHVRLGGVLAPPYDVISDEQRTALYGRDLRNVVRIDYGETFADDLAGVNDRYTRAAAHLRAWQELGILVRSAPSYVVTVHEFVLADGSPRRRIGIFGTVAARPWETSDLRPHERTLRGPKEDRLRLLRATSAQTSAVFGLWDGAPEIDALLAEVIAGPTYMGGRTGGDSGDGDPEKHIVWHVTDPTMCERIHEAFVDARLYIADGHHRYETNAAYAAERRAEAGAAPDDDAAYERCLVYLCSADDPGLTLLPTHRLVRPREGVPRDPAGLAAVLEPDTDVVTVDTFDEAVRAARLRAATHHAFAVALPDGAALIARRRDPAATPRAGLDVVVLEETVFRPLGIDAAAIGEGALAYTRDTAAVPIAVGSGEAVLGVALNDLGVQQVMAVADAGEVMPQKSTYFHPKVPTGIVIAPV